MQPVSPQSKHADESLVRTLVVPGWLLLLEASQSALSLLMLAAWLLAATASQRLLSSCWLPGRPIKQPVGGLVGRLLLVTAVIYGCRSSCCHNIDLTLGCRPGSRLPTSSLETHLRPQPWTAVRTGQMGWTGRMSKHMDDGRPREAVTGRLPRRSSWRVDTIKATREPSQENQEP